jgi:hypothetical protein
MHRLFCGKWPNNCKCTYECRREVKRSVISDALLVGKLLWYWLLRRL